MFDKIILYFPLTTLSASISTMTNKDLCVFASSHLILRLENSQTIRKVGWCGGGGVLTGGGVTIALVTCERTG